MLRAVKEVALVEVMEEVVVVTVEVEDTEEVDVEVAYASSFSKETALSERTAGSDTRVEVVVVDMAAIAEVSEEAVEVMEVAATEVVDMVAAVAEVEFASTSRKVLVPMGPTADSSMSRIDTREDIFKR